MVDKAGAQRLLARVDNAGTQIERALEEVRADLVTTDFSQATETNAQLIEKLSAVEDALDEIAVLICDEFDITPTANLHGRE